MLLFWVAAGVLAAAAAGLILLRAARASAQDAAEDPASAIYRRQLSEIDELAERGLIGESERKVAHAEAGRRLLASTDTPTQAWSADATGRVAVLAAAAVSAGAALVLYLTLGAPGTPDQPYGARLKAWRSADLRSLTPPELAAVLRQVTAERPGDPEGKRLLGVAEAASDNFPAAVHALRDAVRLAPDRPDLWRSLGEAQVFAAGGKVGPEAQASFQEVLKRTPGDLGARFYLAQGKVEAGDGAAGAADFRTILSEIPPGDERRPVLEAAIARAEGRNVATGDPQQLAMIQGMVASLAAKLKANPDDSDGWVRLVRAYAVLGQTKDRDSAYAAARARYAGTPKVLADLDLAARAEPMR